MLQNCSTGKLRVRVVCTGVFDVFVLSLVLQMPLINIKAGPSPAILKTVLKTAREEKGLTEEELAEVVCLREWNVKEMEEGDTCLTFYSMAIKVNAAKRIGAYLGLKESEYLRLATELHIGP